MSTMNKVVLGLGVVVFLVVISIVGSIWSSNNDWITMEQGIKAQFDQNKNNYDNYFKTLKEVAQVPAMYVKGLKEVYYGCMTGRYGTNGSRAAFQWIKEHNPKFDASMYSKIQNIIVAGRKDFESNQKVLIDKKRLYQTEIQKFPGTVIASMLGFPKIDLEQFDIVTSDSTEKAFKEKKSDYIKLN